VLRKPTRLQVGNLPRQLGPQALVRVEAQNPVVRRRVDRKILLVDHSGPVALDHARAGFGGDFTGTIGRVRVDDEDLIAEFQRG
jgi:hypothetical protein